MEQIILKISMGLLTALILSLLLFSTILIMGYRRNIPKELLTAKQHARNEIYKQIILPILEKHGFIQAPLSGMLNGWYSGIMLYGYTLARIKNQKIEILEFYISRETNIIRIELYIYNVNQKINSFNELSEDWYRKVVKYKIQPFNPFKSDKIFKFNSFRELKELDKSKRQLIRKIETEFADIELKINQLYKTNNTVVIDKYGNLMKTN